MGLLLVLEPLALAAYRSLEQAPSVAGAAAVYAVEVVIGLMIVIAAVLTGVGRRERHGRTG